MKRQAIVAITAALCWAGSLHAVDWNQYHGIQSDKKTTEALTSTAFLGRTDSKRWKVPTPLGFSSFSVVGNRAFTLIAEEDEDGLDALKPVFATDQASSAHVVDDRAQVLERVASEMGRLLTGAGFVDVDTSTDHLAGRPVVAVEAVAPR